MHVRPSFSEILSAPIMKSTIKNMFGEKQFDIVERLVVTYFFYIVNLATG